MMAHAAPRNRRSWRAPRWGQIFLALAVYSIACLLSLLTVLGSVWLVWAAWTALGVK